MKLNLEALLVLESIHRNGSFALAAQELHKVPSALTYTINKLEEQLGIEIFDRKGHKAVLTPMGEYLLKQSHRLLQSANEIERNIKMQKTGWEQTLNIAYDQLIPFGNIIPLITRFYEKCPQVELKLTAEVLGGCWDALLHKRVDLVIGVTGDPPIREGLNIQPLGQIDFVFVTCPGHELTKSKREITNEIVKQYRIVAVSDSSLSPQKRTTGIIPGQNILTVSNFNEKIEAIKAGIGVGYLPSLMAQKYLSRGALVAVEINKLKTSGTVSFAWFDDNLGNAKRWFIEYLMDKDNQEQILKA